MSSAMYKSQTAALGVHTLQPPPHAGGSSYRGHHSDDGEKRGGFGGGGAGGGGSTRRRDDVSPMGMPGVHYVRHTPHSHVDAPHTPSLPMWKQLYVWRETCAARIQICRTKTADYIQVHAESDVYLFLSAVYAC